MASDFFEEGECTQEQKQRGSQGGKMNPAVHPILYLPEYGKRPRTSQNAPGLAALSNHVKAYSGLMVSSVRCDGLSNTEERMKGTGRHPAIND